MTIIDLEGLDLTSGIKGALRPSNYTLHEYLPSFVFQVVILLTG